MKPKVMICFGSPNVLGLIMNQLAASPDMPFPSPSAALMRTDEEQYDGRRQHIEGSTAYGLVRLKG